MIKSKIIDAYKDWFASIPEFQPDFAVTISTTTRDTISGETGLRYFHNRLTRYVNKGIPKYNQVTPKIVGFSELHADKTVHYHLSIDTGRKFKSAERFENAVAKILPECRFLKSNDFHVKDRYSDGWDRYISKFGTAAGEDKSAAEWPIAVHHLLLGLRLCASWRLRIFGRWSRCIAHTIR